MDDCVTVMSYDKVFPLIRVDTTMTGEDYRSILRRFLDNNFPGRRSARSTIGHQGAPPGNPFTFHAGYHAACPLGVIFSCEGGGMVGRLLQLRDSLPQT